MSIRFEIDRPKLEGDDALVGWFRLFGAEFLRAAQALAAGRISGGTGAYERSFEVELIPGSPPSLKCGNSSPIAIYVEEDTQPHVIEPKPKGRRSFTNPAKPGMLRFFDPPGGGADAAVFARKVNHPGTEGKHIVRDAVSVAADNMLSRTSQ